MEVLSDSPAAMMERKRSHHEMMEADAPPPPPPHRLRVRIRLPRSRCTHPAFLDGFCIQCLKPKGDLASSDADGSTLRVDYMQPGLKLRRETMENLRTESIKNVAEEKKLVLILDLDHTLLHSVHLSAAGDFKKLLSYPSMKRQLRVFEKIGYITKIRPFVRSFLEEASRLFTMYVYTMGHRPYALSMAYMLDPSGEYFFPSRVIAREDCTAPRRKGLDVVPADERIVVVLDDTLSVWKRHRRNLVHVKGYDFWRRPSLFHMLKDDDARHLETVLGVLRRVHAAVFDPVLGLDLATRDVPRVLKKMRREVLRGCRLLVEAEAKGGHVWRMAKRLGATPTVEADDTVTHVLCSSTGCTNAQWAAGHDKFPVSAEWVEAAHFQWRRPPERDFMVHSCSAAAADSDKKKIKLIIFSRHSPSS